MQNDMESCKMHKETAKFKLVFVQNVVKGTQAGDDVVNGTQKSRKSLGSPSPTEGGFDSGFRPFSYRLVEITARTGSQVYGAVVFISTPYARKCYRQHCVWSLQSHPFARLRCDVPGGRSRQWCASVWMRRPWKYLREEIRGRGP